MRIIKNCEFTRIEASDYTLEISADLINVIIAGESIARLVPRSAMNITSDDNESAICDIETEEISFTQVSESPAVFQWISRSSLWNEKIYKLTCRENRAEYTVTVRGKGRLDSVNYFMYNKFESDDHVGKVYGSQEFYEGFYPNIYERGEDGTYPADRAHDIHPTLSVPPMFFHSFRTAGISKLLSFGVVAEMGEHNFSKLAYSPAMHFTTNQDGHVYVNGEWTAPKMVIYTADDYYDAAERYCDFYFDNGICSRGSDDKKPRFWYGPIACGWFEQIANTTATEGPLQKSNETLYNNMLEKLEKKDLHPKILIIDDKWMDKYGTAHPNPAQWPDLRRFIDQNLENGIHTFMWFKLWDSEGIPEEYCVWDELQQRFVCDPTNPGYREILRETIHRIISSDEGCYNAEGLKIDFGFWQPYGRKAKTYSSKYGTELLYEYIKFIRDVAKEAKPHAVINASPCHPIFASIVDHARLHDYDSPNRRTLEEFTHRAKIWGTALPSSLIDMDGGSRSTNRDVMRFLLGQSKLGIPDLYFVSDFPNGLKLTDEEWGRVSQAWKDYSAKTDIMLNNN